MIEYPPEKEAVTASQLISQKLADLGDWRGEMLGQVRALIEQTDPDIIEERILRRAGRKEGHRPFRETGILRG